MSLVTPRLTSVEINKYIQQITEPIYQEARFLGILKAFGRIETHVAHDIRWRARIYRHEPTPITGYPVNTQFTAPRRHVEAVLPWRAYGLGEYITRTERLMGSDKASNLPVLVENVVKWMMEDFKVYLQKVLYQDGESGTDAVHGLESLFGYGSQLSNVPVYQPDDTYATLATDLGAHGGTCTGTWPEATNVDTEYCAWSPLIIEYLDSNLTPEGVTTATWATNWKAATRYATTWLLALQGVTPNVMLVHPDLLRQAKDSVDPYRELAVTSTAPIADMGIKAVHFEGMDMVADPYCTKGTAYLLPMKHVSLLLLQKQLIEVHEDTDPYVNNMIFMDFHGNMKFDTPAFFAKLTTASD